MCERFFGTFLLYPPSEFVEALVRISFALYAHHGTQHLSAVDKVSSALLRSIASNLMLLYFCVKVKLTVNKLRQLKRRMDRAPDNQSPLGAVRKHDDQN